MGRVASEQECLNFAATTVVNREDEVDATCPIRIGNIRGRPNGWMIGMRVVKAENFQVSFISDGVEADEFGGIDGVACRPGDGHGRRCGDGEKHTHRLAMAMAEEHAGTFERVGRFGLEVHSIEYGLGDLKQRRRLRGGWFGLRPSGPMCES